MHSKLSEFIATGELPPSSKERNLLLDLARAELSQTRTNTNTQMTYFGKHKTDREELISLQELEAKAAASGLTAQAEMPVIPAATDAHLKSSGKPTVHRAALPTNPTSAAAGITGFTPAVKPTATKAGFDSLSPEDRMRFVKAGGKIVSAETIKPHSVKGVLTRAGLAAMKPDQRMAHFKRGGTLAD